MLCWTKLRLTHMCHDNLKADLKDNTNQAIGVDTEMQKMEKHARNCKIFNESDATAIKQASADMQDKSDAIKKLMKEVKDVME